MDNMIGTSTTNTLTGTSGDNLLIGKAGDDYIDGGGGSDIIIAGAGNDTIVYDEIDKRIDGGTGLDTLLFLGANQSLNFTQNHSVTNVEQIWLEGGGGHHLWFTAADIIRVSDNDKLVIRGDNTDHITLGDLSGWTFPTQVNANGSITFTNGMASFTARPGMQIDGYSQAATITLFPSEPLSVQEDTDPTPDGYLSLIFSAVISDPNLGESVLSLASDSTNLGSLSLISKVSTSLGIRYKYQYTVLNDDVQYLNTGDSATDKFHLTSLDGTTKDVSIAIAGQDEFVNHDPIAVSYDPTIYRFFGAPTTEEILANTVTRTGTIVVTDADLADTISGSVSSSHLTLSAPVQTDPASNAWSFTWTYAINDDDVQRVVQGNGVSNEDISITFTDNHGGSSVVSMSFIISDYIDPGLFVDKKVGTTGNDTVSVIAHEWYFGDSGNDLLTGLSATSFIVGGTGDDTFSGNGTMFGDEGNDKFLLNAGLTNGSKAYGGDGDDQFLLKNTFDSQVFGNAGSDLFQIDPTNTNLSISGGSGSDAFVLTGTSSGPNVWILDFDFSALDQGGDTLELIPPITQSGAPGIIMVQKTAAPGSADVPAGVTNYYQLWMTTDPGPFEDSVPFYFVLNLVASDGATTHNGTDMLNHLIYHTVH